MRKRIQIPATHFTLGPDSIVIDTPSHLTVHAISYTRIQEKKDVSSVRIMCSHVLRDFIRFVMHV